MVPLTARLLGAAIALTMTTAGVGAAAEPIRVCVTPGEASSVLLILAPEAVAAVGTICAQALPSTALLRQPGGNFLARYRSEADAAWPRARGAFDKLVGGGSGLFDADQLRPLLRAVVLPLLVGQIQPRDCVPIDHIVTLLAPLPPASVVDLLVTFIQIDNDKRARSGRPAGLPVCPAPPAQH